MKDRIRQLMESKRMTQKDFAAQLCVAEATLSSVYTGRTRPTNNLVSAIHEAFPEVSIPWLMFGEGDMVESPSSATPPSVSSAPVGGQEPTLFPQDLFSAASAPQNTASPVVPVQPLVRETVKYIDKPQRKITEIRVFYDDGTYETFSA